MNLTKKSEGYF